MLTLISAALSIFTDIYFMAQLVVRNLENTVKEQLRHRARRNGRSMEAEAREILRNAVVGEPVPTSPFCPEFADFTSGRGRLASDVSELQEHKLKAATFE